MAAYVPRQSSSSSSIESSSHAQNGIETFSTNRMNPNDDSIDIVKCSSGLDIPRTPAPPQIHDPRHSESGQLKTPTSANVLGDASNFQHNLVPSPPRTGALDSLQTPITFHNTPFPSHPTFSLDTQIVLMIQGEYITFDLEALGPDTTVIIDLLKLTSSERGVWMVVGAYYRRKGLPRCAIEVMEMLLEVLGQYKVPQSSLGPIFLLLSGCEADLAKVAKAGGIDPSGHYRNAQQYLFKVYGDTKAGDIAITASATGTRAKQPAPPIQTVTATATNSASRRTIVAPSEKRPLPPLVDSQKYYNQCKILEREVQCLRDKNSQQTQVLSDMRSTKRKLEDDVESERQTRRKLQRSLNDIQKERDMARRMENHALDQIKREVECRRRAEEKAELERVKRREVEKVAAGRDAKPFLEGLSVLCQRAAVAGDMGASIIQVPGLDIGRFRVGDVDGMSASDRSTSRASPGY